MLFCHFKNISINHFVCCELLAPAGRDVQHHPVPPSRPAAPPPAPAPPPRLLALGLARLNYQLHRVKRDSWMYSLLLLPLSDPTGSYCQELTTHKHYGVAISNKKP